MQNNSNNHNDKSTIKAKNDFFKQLNEIIAKEDLTQEEISKITGVSQPVISRLFNSEINSSIVTLLRVLIPLGYTIKIVPIDKSK